MKIFLLISKIILILSRVVVEMTISGISSSGNWKDQMICMENSWISGFQICQFCDGWGTVSLRFQCNNKEGNLIETKEFGFDSKYRCDYQQLVSCPLPGIIGINVQSQCCSNCKKLDCLGINDMNLVCRNGGGINSGGGCNEGTWSSFTYCPPMTLGCGIKVREDPKGIGDNFGITDFKLYCCATCKIEAGFFESVGKCVMCHENCLTCNGPNYNQCTGCSGTDILQPTGSCSYETNNKVINNKLNSTGISDMTFFDSGFTRSNTVLIFQCHEWFILKAENVGDFIAKELIDISPHYAIRIKARIYKIDEWNGELIELRIDNVVMNVPEFHNFGKNDDNFYFRNLCGGVETDNIISLDKKYDHSANTLKIIFSANHNKKWGINRISIFVYSCHITCLTCYGKEITNCITCKANSILTSSTCQCLEGFYFDNTCSSDDCIPCKACFTGCKTCTGPGIYQCLSCVANYFYIRQKKEVILYYFFNN